MLFRIALWLLGVRIWWLSRFNKSFQSRLTDKHFIFQLQTKDGDVGRYLDVRGRRISSRSGVHAEPSVAIKFQDSRYAIDMIQAQAKDQTAVMKGVQENKIAITGDFTLLVWFTEIMKFVVPRR